VQSGDVDQGLLGGAPDLLALFGAERPGHAGQAPQRAASDGPHQVEVLEQLFVGRGGWRRFALHLPARLQEQQRIREQTGAQGRGAVPPGLPELSDLPCTQPVAGDGGAEGLARLTIGARHGQKVLHGGVGADLALAHPLLDRSRQILHQTQSPRDPARAAIEATGQSLEIQSEALVQFGQEPALFEGRLRLRAAKRAVEDQGLDLAHRPHRRGHGVAAQQTQCVHPLVAVDHHEAARLARRHHHDRHLLASLGQRAQQTATRLRPPHAQRLVA